MHIMCVLLLVWDLGLPTHPYSLDMDTNEFAENSTASLRCSCKINPTIQLGFVGGKQVVISIGHFHLQQYSHWNVWEYVNSRGVIFESISKEMLGIWSSSCSSHHVECTNTWMRDLRCVCKFKLQSAKPHLYTVELGNPHSGSSSLIQSSAQCGLPCAQEQIQNVELMHGTKIGNGQEDLGMKP